MKKCINCENMAPGNSLLCPECIAKKRSKVIETGEEFTLIHNMYKFRVKDDVLEIHSGTLNKWIKCEGGLEKFKNGEFEIMEGCI